MADYLWFEGKETNTKISDTQEGGSGEQEFAEWSNFLDNVLSPLDAYTNLKEIRNFRPLTGSIS